MNTEHFGHNCNNGKRSGKIYRAQFPCPCRSYDVECCPVCYQGAAVRGGYGVSNCFTVENDAPFCIGFNHSGFGLIPYLYCICWGGMILGDHAKSIGYLGHGPCAKSKVSLWRMFLHTVDIQLIIVCRQSTTWYVLLFKYAVFRLSVCTTFTIRHMGFRTLIQRVVHVWCVSTFAGAVSNWCQYHFRQS